jgi:tetratricopeptide (TPR) repeat protein
LRSSLLKDYVLFLKRQNRSKEAVDLLLKEIGESPADSQSAIQAARLLSFDFEKHVSVDDEVLWTWLANRTKWEYTEELLLWRMLENTVPAERVFEREIPENNITERLDKNFSRAEKLAFNNDPTRACTLGWIENRMGFPKRSIALLKHAYENAKEKELKEKSAFNLLESYLDTGNWKSAEEIFPEAAKRLTYKEIPEWYSRAAIAAAKSGAKEVAMRLWRNVANLYPASLGSLDVIAKYGLKDELKEFYNQMQKKMPSSEVPAKAISIIEN